MAKVHIGIVTYNSLQDLPRCLAGIRRQTFPAIHVVALDNASTDSTVTWLRSEAPDVALTSCDANLGFATAHNRLIASCALQPGDYYLPLNPDVMLEPACVDSLVRALERRAAGWVTGKLLMVEEEPVAHPPMIYSVGHALRRDGYVINIGYGLPDDGRFDDEREVFGAPGAAPLYSYHFISALSADQPFFDEDMFLYAEDTDLDWRACLQGWRCWYVPSAVALHKGSTPAWELKARAVANRYLSVIKNAYLIDLLTYNLWIIAAHCLLRLVLTPAFGFQLIARFVRLAPRFWNKRRKPRIPRSEMQGWFAWGRRQPTSQPVPFAHRLRAALSQRPRSSRP